MKTYIGIDNGVTGTIGIVSDNFSKFVLTPVKKEQNYTKKKDIITRIDSVALIKLLEEVSSNVDVLAVLERAMLNPTRWKASVSAARALESTQTILETLHIPYMFIDSKEWQRMLLPKGCEGAELKKASMDIGCRLFPEHSTLITKHKDADGILIAEYARRSNL